MIKIVPGMTLTVQVDDEEIIQIPNTAEGRGRLYDLIKKSKDHVSFTRKLKWFDDDDLQLLAMVRLAQTDE